MKLQLIVRSLADHNLVNGIIMLSDSSGFKIVNRSYVPGKIDSVCPGTYWINVSNKGFENYSQQVNISNDTSFTILLIKEITSLREVALSAITKKKEDLTSLTTSEIKGLQLLQTRGNTLGESLKSIPGLNSLQTGPGLSKPIIHGLHGNRILILNNGIKQEGQQWGSEHAPEIDPFIASKITIVKGAASVRYGSDAISGVIILDPQILDPLKNFEGELNFIAATNGKLGALSALGQGKLINIPGLSWRLQGTLKRAGNFRSPAYYLKNSGIEERDYSLATSYKKKNYGVDLYYSKFYNQVGIFEGSHVGNISDLYAAFKRKIPITSSYFTYTINRTYQNIHHDFFKTASFYKLKNENRLQLIFSAQTNLREEYDIDLPYTNDPAVLKKPQISFKIKTHAVDLIYEMHTHNHFSGGIGVSGSTQGNVFKGIRYLIPNFRNYTGGAFCVERFIKDRLTIEAGLRYDFRWLRVYQLNNNSLQTYHTTTTYKNLTATIGSTYRIANHLSINGNIGSGWRAPSINELYIDGIHLSAASYEKGDSTLKSERSYDFTISTKYEHEKLSAEVVLYNNVINNFIYANPSLQPIQLISGTYPFFNYTQANVNLAGFDVDISYKIFKPVTLISKTSLLRAWNRTIHNYLIFMPADKFDNTIKYSVTRAGRFNNLYVSLQNISVLKQTRIPDNSDYVAPPAAYTIFNLGIGCQTHVAKKELSLNLGIDNVTNTTYRDYLNRFRYYADDLGINAILRTKLNF